MVKFVNENMRMFGCIFYQADGSSFILLLYFDETTFARHLSSQNLSMYFADDFL